MTSQFSVLLRKLRQRTSLTQEDLAERAGLSVRTIRRLETSERTNPQLETVRMLGDALGLDPEERATMLAIADGQAPRDTEQPTATEPTVNGRRAESAVERRLLEAADDLAHAVGARLSREEELRRIQDPCPLPVRWDLAPDAVLDHWENICRVVPGESARPLDLAGHLPEITEVHRRIPSGRLVVLGRAGSGKSVLALRFVLDMLRTRDGGDAVPVVFSLGSWDPTTTGFRDWLAGQLVRDYPGLAAKGCGESNLATALVEAGRILPVLDGFDELATGLHRDALDALNATPLPLLLTSRPGEYAAVAATDPLTAAAAVRLTDLTVTDLANYLPRTARKNAGSTVWDPVLNELRDHPDRPASVSLRAVLTTPLMVGLARAVYSDNDGADPSELLDTDRFGSQYALEDHLLGRFVPTVYRDRRSRWDPERVRNWLGYLAGHLDRLGTPDLAWWQLGTTMRRATRMLVAGAVSGLAVALFSGLVIFLADTPAAGRGLTNALVAALQNWPGFGLALGLAHGAGLRLCGGAFEPSRVRLRLRGGARRPRARYGSRLTVGIVGGVGLGLTLALASAAGTNPMGFVELGFLGVLAAGAGLGTLTGLGWGLMAGLESPADIRTAAGPADLMRTNRAIVVVEFVGWGLVLGLAHLLVITLAVGYLTPVALPLDLVLGPVIGLVIGINLSAWGQWLVFGRVWLPLTGQLPWSVAAFLDDACRRGVLRQVGAGYQFRHARLQAHLSTPADLRLSMGHGKPVPSPGPAPASTPTSMACTTQSRTSRAQSPGYCIRTGHTVSSPRP